MQIKSIDHFVLTVQDIDATLKFYSTVLGMEPLRFETGGGVRVALKFGIQKINLHQRGAEFKPGADKPLTGTGDFCLLTDTPLDEVIRKLGDHGVEIIEGPVDKTGAAGPLRSVYLRDPDQNLVEISNQV